MMRIARVVPMLVAITLGCAPMLHAQTAASQAATTSDEMPGYAEFNAGATFGHKSDASFGGEGGYRIHQDLFVFGEVGHIGNAASADLESRAINIANNAGATSDVVAKVTYFDFGIRYVFVTNSPKIHPYVTAGFGGATVTTETTFSVNGTVVPPDSIGITVGNDLAGTQTAPFFMLGGGANVDFGSRYFADVSYRYGHVSGKTDSNGVTTLEGFNTNRLQVGVGIKF